MLEVGKKQQTGNLLEAITITQISSYWGKIYGR